MTEGSRRLRVLTGLFVPAVLIFHGLGVTSAAAIEPEATDIVVWTVNTALNSKSGGPCEEVGCKFGKFSNAVASKASCPDVVLGQEIRSVSDADTFKNELDQISSNCGIYRRYFYDGGSPNSRAKVSIAWRADRFVQAKVGGNFDAYNKREKSQASPSEPAECTQNIDLGSNTPSRYVTAVKLLDQNIAGKAVIVGSVHWDSQLTVECVEKNLNDFANGIKSRWGSSIPVIFGGDHNERPARDEDRADTRKEQTLQDWYANFTSSGHSDAIKRWYSTSDLNGNGFPDICEQWTYRQDLHTEPPYNSDCSTEGHFRIDFTFYRGLSNSQGYTEKGWVGSRAKGNFYSDHRALVTRYAY